MRRGRETHADSVLDWAFNNALDLHADLLLNQHLPAPREAVASRGGRGDDVRMRVRERGVEGGSRGRRALTAS
eukprot:1021374-Rhodomonas_salina.1